MNVLPVLQQVVIANIVFIVVFCYSLVNKDEYIIIYAYTSVQSVITFDRLGRCFGFVIDLCLCVFFCCCRFSVNKDLCMK